MYAKIFEQIYDSSIADHWQTRIVFQDMLILCDRDGIIDKTPEAIAARTRLPLDMVKTAIIELESPDPRSRSIEAEGRRLIRLDDHRDWGWRIVNYDSYRSMKDEFDRKAYMKNYMQKYRKPLNSSLTPVLQINLGTSASASDQYKEKEGVGEKEAFETFWREYPKKMAKQAAEKAFKKSKCHIFVAKILLALKEQKKSEQWNRDAGQFIPYPATWLNQGRWEDELFTANGNGNGHQNGNGQTIPEKFERLWDESHPPLRKHFQSDEAFEIFTKDYAKWKEKRASLNHH